jgi:hypothetical protein
MERLKKGLILMVSILAVLFLPKNVFAEENDNTSVDEKTTVEESSNAWKAEQPTKITTSEGINVDVIMEAVCTYKYSSGRCGQYQFIYTATFTIPEDYEEDTFTISPDIFQEINEDGLNGYVLSQPGDNLKINVIIVNNSKYEYDYVEDSFTISPDTTVVYGKKDKEVKGEAATFNGGTAETVDTVYRVYNKALKSLVGMFYKVSDIKNAITDENIEKELLKITDENGNLKYPNGIKDLDKYYLDYYKNYYNHEEYTSLTQFSNEELSDIISNGTIGNALETNATLIALTYDYFYNSLLTFEFETTESSENSANSIGEYMRTEGLGEDVVINDIGSVEPDKEYSLTESKLKLDGAKTGNAYQGYNFNFHMHISYEVAKGNVIVNYVTTDGEKLSDEITSTGKVNDEYETENKSFTGYKLVKVEGNTTGTYTKEDINVTYIYEKEVTTSVITTSSYEIVPPKTGVTTNYFDIELIIKKLFSFLISFII